MIRFCCPCLSVVILAACLATGCADGNSRAEAREREIRDIVTVGMDIDEASRLLRDAGFTVGDKYHPTEAADYWLVHVSLREDIPLSETVRETVGAGPGSSKAVVTLKADSVGTILSIQ